MHDWAYIIMKVFQIQEDSHPHARTRENFHKKTWGSIGIFVLLIVVVFGRCIFFEYTHYDDSVIVFENPLILSGISIENIFYVFTHSFEDLYQPLPAITLMIDRSLWGDWIAGYFIVNLLWHLLCVCTFFWVMLRIIGNYQIVFFASLLFCIHPVQAMIVHSAHLRNETMAAFFMLLSLKMYWDCQVLKTKAVDKMNGHYTTKIHFFNTRRACYFRFIFSLVFMFLSILCKQATIMLPFLLLLLDFWLLKRFPVDSFNSVEKIKKLYPVFLEKLPWLVMAIMGVLLAYYGKHKSIEQFSVEISTKLSPLGVVCTAYMRYIWHLVFPFHHRYIWMTDWVPGSWITIASGAVLIMITIICILNFKRNPWFVFCWGWFIFFLFPLSGVIRFSMEHIALRYLYVPSMGFFLLTAFICHTIISYITQLNIYKTYMKYDYLMCRLGGKQLNAYWIFVVITIALLSSISYWQSGFWKNSEALATRALYLTNGKDQVANLILKMLQEKQERDVLSDQIYQPVFPDFDANAVGNDWNEKHVSLLLGFKHYRQAIAYLDSLDQLPTSLQSEYGGAYLGEAIQALETAHKYLEQAVKNEPQDGYAQYNLALCLFLLGHQEEAIPYIHRAVELLPSNNKIQTLLSLLKKE